MNKSEEPLTDFMQNYADRENVTTSSSSAYGAGVKIMERLDRVRSIGVGGGCLFSGSPKLLSEGNVQLASLLSSSSAFSISVMVSWREEERI